MPDDKRTPVSLADALGRLPAFREAAAAKVVHVLFKGLAPCGTVARIPRDWPAGHVWARVEEREHVSCPACKDWLGRRAGLAAIAEWEAEHGKLTEAELKAARSRIR